MKQKTIFLITGMILFASGIAQQKKRVLFLGNSYTEVNNLPSIIYHLGLSTNDTLVFDSNTPGGYRLQDHYNNATSINKIMSGNWDFVVLQEQSQFPAFPIQQVQQAVFPYAHKLDSLINKYNPCAETMFYMTWGRKNGDASNCANYPPICTYAGMDSLLYLRYMMMTDSNNAVVSPVGAVWKYIRQNFPGIELYQLDESHPALAGSYAAACCFYTCIFRKNPLLIVDDYSLPASDAANIRTAVKTVVYDSLLKWNIGKYDPAANFDFAVTSNTVAFNNLSINATNYVWHFGDGNNSSNENPVHTYSLGGTYSATLIAHYCNTSDTIVLPINIELTTNIKEYDKQNHIELFPNPVSDVLTINTDKAETIYLISALGQTTVLSYNVNNQNLSVDFSSVSSGIYMLVIKTKEKTFIQKVAKE